MIPPSAFDGYDHVIWDWNGTLLDDVALCIDVVSKLLVQHDLPVPSVQQYREIFGFPIADYYARLGFDLSAHSFEDLAHIYIADYASRAHTAPLHDGAADLLAILQGDGKQQSILSASSEAHIHNVIPKHGIDHYFDHMFGIGDHMARSKRARGLELIAASGTDPARTIMVGDTDHDFEVGQAMGVDVLLVAHGHQSYQRLRAVHDRVVGC